MSVESYRDLLAWQKSMDLVEVIYRQTVSWPREELYGLTNQARRAAVSVPANIAEGHGRRGSQEMLHRWAPATRAAATKEKGLRPVQESEVPLSF